MKSVSFYTTNRIANRRSREPKSKSGYRTIPLTEEAVTILKNKKKRIRGFIGGNRENETRYCYYLPDFMHVRISR